MFFEWIVVVFFWRLCCIGCVVIIGLWMFGVNFYLFWILLFYELCDWCVCCYVIIDVKYWCVLYLIGGLRGFNGRVLIFLVYWWILWRISWNVLKIINYILIKINLVIVVLIFNVWVLKIYMFLFFEGVVFVLCEIVWRIWCKLLFYKDFWWVFIFVKCFMIWFVWVVVCFWCMDLVLVVVYICGYFWY